MTGVKKKKNSRGNGRLAAWLLGRRGAGWHNAWRLQNLLKNIRHPALLAVVSLLILSVLLCWQINNLLLQVGTSRGGERPLVIDIPFNSSTAEIAAILQEEGLIKSAFLFRLYARYRDCDGHFQAGKYRLSPEMSLDEIMIRLQQGVIPVEVARFTIPEGFTVEQIAALLAAEGLVKKEEFEEKCVLFPRDLPFEFPAPATASDSEIQYLLEGYLFPDTYEVYAAATPADIIEAMLKRFAQVFDANFRQRAGELGFTIHEIVTLASIVEREARVPEERSLIAAVFHNRLRSEHMPLLQSCATVQYLLGEVKPVLTNEDLGIDSPYNTYLYPHLPPGPIASPGRDALTATLYPAEVDYLFFVSKEDGSGTHYFSTTLQEHNHYKALARQNR